MCLSEHADPATSKDIFQYALKAISPQVNVFVSGIQLSLTVDAPRAGKVYVLCAVLCVEPQFIYAANRHVSLSQLYSLVCHIDPYICAYCVNTC